MFAAVTTGYQAALMGTNKKSSRATFESLKGLFPDLKLALLIGSLEVGRREVLENIAKGEADLIIGIPL